MLDAELELPLLELLELEESGLADTHGPADEDAAPWEALLASALGLLDRAWRLVVWPLHERPVLMCSSRSAQCT